MADRDDLNSAVLADALLEELALRWRQQGASIADLLRPGLSEEEMDELTDPLGLVLPREAKIWWGWHDGAFPAPPSSAPASLGPQLQLLPLADAVQTCVEIRAIMRGTDGQLRP